MYAIAFDMVISDLQKHYGEPYNKAYQEIKELLKKNGFEWVQGSTYMTMNDDLTALVKTVMELSKIEWFKKSVRDLRGFKVESWSNFTDLVKNSQNRRLSSNPGVAYFSFSPSQHFFPKTLEVMRKSRIFAEEKLHSAN